MVEGRNDFIEQRNIKIFVKVEDALHSGRWMNKDGFSGLTNGFARLKGRTSRMQGPSLAQKLERWDVDSKEEGRKPTKGSSRAAIWIFLQPLLSQPNDPFSHAQGNHITNLTGPQGWGTGDSVPDI
jgi:hypothetical protein